MSTNGENVEDAEMTECDGEKVVTMMDVLQEQEEFEEDANAVLGASDDKNCTYNEGYIKRQALYACLTCCSEAKEDPTKRAGVCLACSLTCHENHDLVELYTKRNFCCDCGNSKFNHPCQYTTNKKDLNEENKYNQNFSGLYCTCHRPYPDPEGEEEEMIQCIICEDWLHASHLEATVPTSEAYAEMVCKGCMEKNDFLHDYSRYAVNGDVDVSINESDISICNGDMSKVNGVDESEKVHANGEEVTNMTVEESKDGSDGVSNMTMKESNDGSEVVKEDSEVKNVKDEPADAEISGITNDGNQDEQIEPKISDSDSTNVPEESAEKTNESPVAEETAVAKDEEQNITTSEGAEKEKDTSELTVAESKEETSEDDSNAAASIDAKTTTDVSTNDVTKTEQEQDVTNTKQEQDVNNTKKEPDVTNTKQEQEEIPVSTKATGESDTTSEEAAGQISKDEIEPKTNDTEMETKKEDINGKPNDQPVNGEENDKDAAEPKVNDSVDKDIEMDISSKVEDNTPVTTEGDQTKENKRKLSTEDAVDVTSVKKPKIEGSKCTRLRNERKVYKGATFWPSHFRQKLCTCNECIAMYHDLSVLFLIDPEDTVSAYEMLGKERTDGTASTQYEKGLEALSSLGRIQQINALTEYNKMRDKLLDFLKSFKDRKEVVKEDDIKAFFAGMKPKREPDGVYFCK